MTQPPEQVTLTSEEGEGLIDRVYASDLPRADCTVVAQIIRLHFWLMLAIQEAKLSLKCFRTILFGEPAKRCEEPSVDASPEALASPGADPVLPSALHPPHP